MQKRRSTVSEVEEAPSKMHNEHQQKNSSSPSSPTKERRSTTTPLISSPTKERIAQMTSDGCISRRRGYRGSGSNCDMLAQSLLKIENCTTKKNNRDDDNDDFDDDIQDKSSRHRSKLALTKSISQYQQRRISEAHKSTAERKQNTHDKPRRVKSMHSRRPALARTGSQRFVGKQKQNDDSNDNALEKKLDATRRKSTRSSMSRSKLSANLDDGEAELASPAQSSSGVSLKQHLLRTAESSKERKHHRNHHSRKKRSSLHKSRQEDHERPLECLDPTETETSYHSDVDDIFKFVLRRDTSHGTASTCNDQKTARERSAPVRKPSGEGLPPPVPQLSCSSTAPSDAGSLSNSHLDGEDDFCLSSDASSTRRKRPSGNSKSHPPASPSMLNKKIQSLLIFNTGNNSSKKCLYEAMDDSDLSDY